MWEERRRYRIDIARARVDAQRDADQRAREALAALRRALAGASPRVRAELNPTPAPVATTVRVHDLIDRNADKARERIAAITSQFGEKP